MVSIVCDGMSSMPTFHWCSVPNFLDVRSQTLFLSLSSFFKSCGLYLDNEIGLYNCRIARRRRDVVSRVASRLPASNINASTGPMRCHGVKIGVAQTQPFRWHGACSTDDAGRTGGSERGAEIFNGRNWNLVSYVQKAIEIR
jgi:hypothetical protein